MTMLPYDDRDGVIWMDGKLVPWRDAKIHIINQGLHYAGSVFEGCRAYNGKIFKLREHCIRLKRSAELIGFEIPYTLEQLEEACNKSVSENGFKNAYVRPFAWRGSKVMGISAKGNTIHTAVASWEWPSYFSAEIRERGLKLGLAKWKRPSPETAPSESKAAGLYMICTLSKHQAEAEGYDDALMLDYRGYIAEMTAANLFFVFGKEVHTPTPDCFLNGITRLTVIDMLRERGYSVIERHIKLDEVQKADEVFATGTAAEVTPIGQIVDWKYTVGPITKMLMDDYSDLVHERTPHPAQVA